MATPTTEIPRKAIDDFTGHGWYIIGGEPHVRCGECGHDAGALRGHTVHPDGRVEASIGCPNSGCGWHVWGRLMGWPYGLKMPGEKVDERPRPRNPDQRPPRRGWAPGRYERRCGQCRNPFFGDKRAILCADCAYRKPQPPAPAPEKES